MRPLLQGGELVEVAPLRQASPRLGDILFIRSSRNTPLIHRLIWRRSRNGVPQLLTKGDACAGFDGFIPALQVLGRVERIFFPDKNNEVISLLAPVMRLRAVLMVSRILFSCLGKKISSQRGKGLCPPTR
ncbi:hypothetical protein [Candidatus Electronema sp. JM]|uniref:hypothetical protein n=1 Tax=Candidatus Electronema sp. JM TaxID=3401571 RepID=UPI003AA8DC57